ncbi:DUF6776 family protein [Bordetella genomosp. 5]|nr:DUF6776 family protein [Bordetella genomosp. 5]
MFGRSQRSVFKPSVYQPGKRQRRMPRWLVLLLVGIGLGAGGVLFLQTNYGPQRLTVEQSEQLHTELSASNVERQRLQAQLDEAITQRDNNKSTHETLTTDLGKAKSRIEELNQELVLFQDAMPPDPRGGDIGVRAASFRKQPGGLAYQILVMRENVTDNTFKGKVELDIDGTYSNGRRDRVKSDPMPLNLSRYDHAQGVMPLPDNYNARTVTIRVLDAQDKQVAIRIYNVRG